MDLIPSDLPSNLKGLEGFFKVIRKSDWIDRK